LKRKKTQDNSQRLLMQTLLKQVLLRCRTPVFTDRSFRLQVLPKLTRCAWARPYQEPAPEHKKEGRRQSFVGGVFGGTLKK